MYFFIFEFFLFTFCFFQLGSIFIKKEIKIYNHIENKTKINYPILSEKKKEITIENKIDIKYINFNNEKTNQKNTETKKKFFLKKPEITSIESDDADAIWYEEN